MFSTIFNPRTSKEAKEENSGLSKPRTRETEKEPEFERDDNLSESSRQKPPLSTNKSKPNPSVSDLEFIDASKDEHEPGTEVKVSKKSSLKKLKIMNLSSTDQVGILDRVLNSTQSRELKSSFSLKLTGSRDQEQDGSGTEENGVGLFLKKCVRKKSWTLRALPGECIFNTKELSGWIDFYFD